MQRSAILVQFNALTYSKEMYSLTSRTWFQLATKHSLAQQALLSWVRAPIHWVHYKNEDDNVDKTKMKLLLSLVGLNAAQDLGYIQCTQGCVNRNRNNPYGLLQCQEWCNYGASTAPCENGIHLNPDDETCSSFYRCTDGVRLDNEYCPEGTRFDQVNQRCLWADTVPCNEKKYELTASDIPFGRVYAACLWSCRYSTRGYATWARDFYCYVECKDRINPAKPEKCEDGTYRSGFSN